MQWSAVRARLRRRSCGMGERVWNMYVKGVVRKPLWVEFRRTSQLLPTTSALSLMLSTCWLCFSHVFPQFYCCCVRVVRWVLRCDIVLLWDKMLKHKKVKISECIDLPLLVLIKLTERYTYTYTYPALWLEWKWSYVSYYNHFPWACSGWSSLP